MLIGSVDVLRVNCVAW